MRWFRGHAEAPRLLSLSPLHADEELEGASFPLHAESRLRDMSPVRWARRKSSSSESERNCYNVQTSQVTTERSSQKKDKRRIQEERRRSCEKRNPLLDRVKNTRLSFFKDRDSATREDEEDDDEDNDDEDDDDDVAAPEEDTDRTQFRSMCELSGRGLTRSEFRRSVCEIDLKVTEDEKTRAKRKRRCKSQSRLPARRNLDERFGFLGLGSSTSEKSSRVPDSRPESPKPRRRRWLRGGKDSSDDPVTSRKSMTDVAASEDPEAPLDEVTDGSRYDSVTPSSCLAAKFRAMQDRYLKSSTSRLIAKIYRKDGKDREKRRLRSFSYGALPGLEELRTNPLFEDQDQDDNDSGILDNGSATSSLLDDRCSTGGASGFPTLTTETPSSSPPRLPPRGAFTVLADLERRPSLSPSDSSPEPIDQPRGKSLREFPDTTTIMRNLSLGIERDPLRTTANRTSIDELIRRKIGVGSETRLARSLGRREILDRTETRREADSTSETRRESTSIADPETRSPATRLPVVRSASYTTETTIVRLPRATADQCLGIFIARTPQSSPGYVVAHVVPNGLADREGTLRIGDEILIVNGKRLRGLSMSEARRILGNGSGPGEVDIVVSRQVGADNPRRLKESSVDYENVCVENGHVNGNINNNTITINKNKDSVNNNNNDDSKKNHNNNNNNINATTEQLDSLSSPKSHFRKHHSRHHRDRKNESNRSISSEKSGAVVGASGPQSVSNFCTLPRRPRSSVSTFHTVVFEKGQGKKSLGFTIVGGRDSPKGSIGIFIKSVLPGGQAAEDGRLRAGDEILAVNGQVSHDLTHREAVQLFRNIKSGPLALHLCRRVKNRETQAPKAKSCADLLLVDT